MYLRGGFSVQNATQDHIPRQNEAAGVLAAAVAEVARLKSAGQLTTSALADLISRVERAKTDFVSWARSLGNTRAMRGANEIQANADGVLASLRAETAQITGQPVAPAPLTFSSPEPTPGYVPTVDDRISIPERIIRGIEKVIQPSPYPVFEQPAYQAPAAAAMPEWFLPAAVVVGIMLLQRGRR